MGAHFSEAGGERGHMARQGAALLQKVAERGSGEQKAVCCTGATE